jgi:hypothetical protein
MRHAPVTCPRRRGIASLELVLVFPFVLTIVAALFLIAKLDVAKVQAATDARQQTWGQRGNAPAGQTLRPWHNPQDSQVSSLPQRAVVAGPPFSGQTFQARSGNTLIANAWDSPSVPFPSLSQDLKPHTNVLSMIATSIAMPSFDLLAASLDPGTNPVLIAASVSGQGENYVVLGAGYYLKYTVGLAMDIQMDILNGMWDALQAATFGFAGHTSEGKKIKKALNELAEFINCFDNLFEAANGRLGADPYDN